MNENLEEYKYSRSKWWCPKCDSYRLPDEIKMKHFINGTDWNKDENDKNEDDYSFACTECNGFVREPDLTNCKEVMINFVNGFNWDDVRKDLTIAQINVFSLLCGKWKLGFMSQDEKTEYEKMLATKDANKFSEFLTQWNYIAPFADTSVR